MNKFKANYSFDQAIADSNSSLKLMGNQFDTKSSVLYCPVINGKVTVTLSSGKAVTLHTIPEWKVVDAVESDGKIITALRGQAYDYYLMNILKKCTSEDIALSREVTVMYLHQLMTAFDKGERVVKTIFGLKAFVLPEKAKDLKVNTPIVSDYFSNL